MFRLSQHPSSGVLKTVTAASGTGHNIGTATSLRGQIGTDPDLAMLEGSSCPNSVRVSILREVTTIPDQTPNTKYNVPMSL